MVEPAPYCPLKADLVRSPSGVAFLPEADIGLGPVVVPHALIRRLNLGVVRLI
jgi:hypothetical protein